MNITTEEIGVVHHLPLYKSPRPDGISYSYYKIFFTILSPYLVNLFASLMKGTVPYPQFLHAFITVIPKLGKDPFVPDNNRPIALLNSDYKFFAKILTNKLAQLLLFLIHRDRKGFIPYRQAEDNTKCTINLIDLLNKTNLPVLVLSLEVQKAFDRLHWPFMFATLSHYGFSGPFLQALQALYFKPMSQVQLTYFLSHSFPLSNGTRRGCLLSLLLFILSLEPLAAAFCSHPDVRRVFLHQQEYKLYLFADDILLTLTHPQD